MPRIVLLSNLQVWAAPPLPDMETMRKRHAQHQEETRKRMAAQQRPGTISGFGGTANHNPTTGSGSSGMSQWEDDTFVVQTYRQHQDHELMVIALRGENGPSSRTFSMVPHSSPSSLSLRCPSRYPSQPSISCSRERGRKGPRPMNDRRWLRDSDSE